MTLKINNPSIIAVRDLFHKYGFTKKVSYLIRRRLKHEKPLSAETFIRRLLVKHKLLFLRLSLQKNKIREFRQPIAILQVLSKRQVFYFKEIEVNRLILRKISKKYVINRQIFRKSFRNVEILNLGQQKSSKLLNALNKRYQEQGRSLEKRKLKSVSVAKIREQNQIITSDDCNSEEIKHQIYLKNVCSEPGYVSKDPNACRKEHLSISDRPFSCLKCNSSFKRMHHLKRHIKNVHKVTSNTQVNQLIHCSQKTKAI